MGLIIALTGHKGGVGRTTLAIMLASVARRAGLRTLLLDASHDRGALTWAATHRETAPTTLRLAPARPGEQLGRSPVSDLAFGHDLTIVDMSARDELTCARVLDAADIALVVCTPSPLDAWTLGDSLDLVRERAVSNPRLLASVLLNRVDPRTSLGRDAGDQLRRQDVPVLGVEVRQRVAYAEALAGDAVLADVDPEAAEEIQALLVALTHMARTAAAELPQDAVN